MVVWRGALAGVLWLLGCAGALAAGLPDFPALVKRNAGSVVNISSIGKLAAATEPAADDNSDDGDEDASPDAADALGTGLVIAADGWLLTNRHVIADAEDIVVRLPDRRELPARVIGTDERTDLALLKIDADGLQPATVGRADALEVGEWVLAIGSPFGFEQSVTAGIVSAKGRSLPSEPYVAYIQTDVPINPGNSGGPLINLRGEVIGINSQIYSQTGGYMGLSFAIPIETAMDVARQLRDSGHVSRGWLGVLVQPLTRDLAESFGLASPRGALVSRVFPDGPAAAAGLRTGDVITRFDSHEIDLSTALPPLVGATGVDRRVEVAIMRGGKPQTLAVQIAALPDNEPPVASTEPVVTSERSLDRLGLRVAPVPPELRRQLGIPEGGVLVEQVDNSRAARAGLRQGDVLGMLNGAQIRDPDAFDRTLEDLPAGRAIALLVLRRSGPAYLALRVP